MAIGPIKKVSFDPNARDGDGDMLVQESTSFERPAKPSVPGGLTGAVKKNSKKPINPKYEKVATGCGDCFDSAAKTLSSFVEKNPDRMDDFKLVHGIPLGTGGEAEGLRYNHAWVEETIRMTDDQIDKMVESWPEDRREAIKKQMGPMLSEMVLVRDYSNGRKVDIPRDIYYKIGNIEESSNQKYSYKEMMDQQKSTGHYGPYGLTGAVTRRAERPTEVRGSRLSPLRSTNVADTDISTGKGLRAAAIFETDAFKRMNEGQQRVFLGVSTETFEKLKQPNATIEVGAADRIAVNAFGMHPMEIWGDEYMEQEILSPSKKDKPPKLLSAREEEVLDLRANGFNDTEIAKQLGISRQRVFQLKTRALEKRDQFSLMEDDEIEEKIKAQTARSVATSIFLDTGTSPTGLLGAMTNEDNFDPSDPMFESPQEREDREQAFGDYISQKYLQPWEEDFNTREGRNPAEQEYLDYIDSLDLEDVAEEFELETGISGWGLEFDEEGNALTAEWAHAGFNSEEEYEEWFDGPMSDIIGETRPDKTQGTLFDDNKWEDYRKSEDYVTYGGTEDLMTRNTEQHKTFTEWAKSEDWTKFHKEHFDWWAFPIDEVSNSYGERFRVPEDEVIKLRKDKDFLKRLDENLTNATAAYGWDIKSGKWIGDDIRDPDQVPQSLSQIRLYKMARSAMVFGRCSHFRSLQRMYDNLSSFGWYKNQDEGFWAVDHPCSKTE